MSTFNAEIYIGNRGNTILSFDLYLGTGTTQNYNCNSDSGVTFNTFIHTGTTRVYQNVLWSDMYSGQTLFVDSIPMGTTHIKVVANRLSGVCNNLQPQIICIQGRPTPTPTPSPSPTSSPTATPTPTPSPTSTSTPTPTPTSTSTPTPTATATSTPTPTPTSTSVVIEVTITVKYHGAVEPSGNLACNTGTDIQVVMNSSNFCTATTYVSSYFTSIGTGTFWISYNGKYRQIYHSSGNSAIQSGTCKDCVGVEPTYYYYAMGDCTDMKYSGIERTVFGFDAPLVLTVCMNETQISQWYETANWAQQTLSIDYNDPCGFGDSYVSTIIARSSTEIAEKTVFNINNQCLSVVSVDSEYVSGYTVDLDEETSIGIGWDACSTCFPPFTGFTLAIYSGTTCDTDENVIATSIFDLQNKLPAIYGLQSYDGNGVLSGEPFCATITTYVGLQTVSEDPSQFVPGNSIVATGPISLIPSQNFTGYTSCEACDALPKKYYIAGERCDDPQFSTQVWSATLPTIQTGNTFTIDYPGLTSYCWRAIQVDTIKTFAFNDLGIGIASTGCDCNGDNGGGDINVDNIVASSTESSNTGSECQSPQSQNYSETTITEMELIFRDSSNNPVTPNDTVEYRAGGTWIPLTVTGSSITFSVTLTYGDRTACDGGGTYADVLEVKVGTVTILSYTACSS